MKSNIDEKKYVQKTKNLIGRKVRAICPAGVKMTKEPWDGKYRTLRNYEEVGVLIEGYIQKVLIIDAEINMSYNTDECLDEWPYMQLYVEFYDPSLSSYSNGWVGAGTVCLIGEK